MVLLLPGQSREEVIAGYQKQIEYFKGKIADLETEIQILAGIPQEKEQRTLL